MATVGHEELQELGQSLIIYCALVGEMRWIKLPDCTLHCSLSTPQVHGPGLLSLHMTGPRTRLAVSRHVT